MNPILECRNLSKKYGNHFYALNDLTLSLDSGQIVGLLGPNGSGKTTLIKLINGLLNPSSGEVLIDGKAPGVDTKKIVSYLPERTYLDESMKVRDIIRFFADFYDNFITDRAYRCFRIWKFPQTQGCAPCPRVRGKGTADSGHEPGR